MYMSYCRMRGALSELRACLSEVDDHINEEAEYSVSDHEIEAFRNIVKEMHGWMVEAELLTDDGELDEVALDGVCECLKEGTEE